MAIIETNHKVKLSPSGIGTVGARLSDTATGRASSIKRHPAGKKRDLSVLEGLKVQESKQQVEDDLAELDAWIAEYDAVRAELEAKAVEREAQAEIRRKAHLTLVADWK